MFRCTPSSHHVQGVSLAQRTGSATARRIPWETPASDTIDYAAQTEIFSRYTSNTSQIVSVRKRMLAPWMFRKLRDPLGFSLVFPMEDLKGGVLPVFTRNTYLLALPVAINLSILIGGILLGRVVSRRGGIGFAAFHGEAVFIAVAFLIVIVSFAAVIHYPFFGYRKTFMLMACVGGMLGMRVNAAGKAKSRIADNTNE